MEHSMYSSWVVVIRIALYEESTIALANSFSQLGVVSILHFVQCFI